MSKSCQSKKKQGKSIEDIKFISLTYSVHANDFVRLVLPVDWGFYFFIQLRFFHNICEMFPWLNQFFFTEKLVMPRNK